MTAKVQKRKRMEKNRKKILEKEIKGNHTLRAKKTRKGKKKKTIAYKVS